MAFMADCAFTLWLYGVLPMWIAAGFADWCCHRLTSIERTSGWRESAFHLVMFVQTGSAALLALVLETTPAVLATMAAFIAAHEATTWLELRFVVDRRDVGPFEQMVHSLLEVLPLTGLFLLMLVSSPAGQTGFQLRQEPLPADHLIALLAAVVTFNLLPLLEEFWRCMRRIFREGS
jgi:hypothetical protein